MGVTIFTLSNKDKKADLDEIKFITMLDILKYRNKVLWKYFCVMYDRIDPNNTYTTKEENSKKLKRIKFDN